MNSNLRIIGALCLSACLPAMAATTLAIGSSNALAVRKDGAVLAWGGNGYGQLGNGYANNAYVPILSLLRQGTVAVASGDGHAMALQKDGSVWSWGLNTDGQLGSADQLNHRRPGQVVYMSEIKAIAAGGSHALAMRADGSVWSWGKNWSGQLGVGNTTSSNVPLKVSGLSGIVAIAAGHQFSLALNANGDLYAWGANSALQLGTPSGSNNTVPTRVVGLPPVAAIAAGLIHSLALGRDGRVYSWGWNSSCQLGHPVPSGLYCRESRVPISVPNLFGVKAVAAGDDHSAVLKNDGTVWSWGSNRFGQLGNNGAIGVSQVSMVPVPAAGLSAVVEIAAGAATTLTRTDVGSVFGFGQNTKGQIGNGLAEMDADGQYEVARVPVQAVGLGGEGKLQLGSIYDGR